MKYFLGNQQETKQEEIQNQTEESVTSVPITDERNLDADYEKVLLVNRKLLGEDKAKREINVKHYIGNDGTATAIYSGKAVHYIEEQTAELKEVDNSLSDDGEGMRTNANAFITRFKKNAEDGEIYELTKGNCKVGLKSKELAGNCNCGNNICTCEEANAVQSKMRFQDVSENVDLQYTVDSDRVKENIIVKQKGERYEYNFEVALQNLSVGISEDKKTLQLIDQNSGKVQFYIPSPFMTDAAGAYSDLVYYEIAEQNENTLSLKVIADGAWMNAQERVFPVVIDPQIVVQDSSIFEFDYYELVEKKYSGGSYNEWVKWNVVPDPVKIDATHKMTVRVDKNKFPFQLNSVNEVTFSLYASQTGACKINNVIYNLIKDGELKVNVTNSFKSTSSELKIELKEGNVEIYRFSNGQYPMKLEINYLKHKAEYRTLPLAGGVSCELDEVTGECVGKFSDMEIGSSALTLPIGHVHKKSSDNYGCGEDWRLNLHETLKKSGDEYFYTDGSGQVHAVDEVYYYVVNSSRHTVDKSKVIVEADGSLSCSIDGVKYPVTRDMRTEAGLRVVTRLEGVKYAEHIEQRQDEEKQLEEYINSYKKTLNDLYDIVKSDIKETSVKNLRKLLFFDSLSYVDSILSTFNASTHAILTCSEFIQAKNLKINAENGKGTDTTNLFYDEQLEKVWTDAKEKPEQIRKLYRDYLTKKEQLKQLQRQMPTSYLVDDEDGTILCFNKDGNLCAATDRYENSISIEWSDISVNGENREAITAVYDGERKATLTYDRDGLLKSITDPLGNRAEYTYSSANRLMKTVYSDGRTYTFNYNANGDLIGVKSGAEGETATLQYHGYKLRYINYGVTFETLTDTGAPGAAAGTGRRTITYGTDYTSIGNGEETEYAKYGEEQGGYKKRCWYTVRNGKAGGLTLHRYVPRRFEFTLMPKKKREIKDLGAVDESIEENMDGYLPPLKTLAGTNGEYESYAEADWEKTELDSFNRPVVTKTNWRRTGTGTDGRTEYTYYETEYRYDGENEHYPCVKKKTTLYRSKEGKNINTSEKEVTVEEYTYCEHGNLVKTERYVEGEEGTTGRTVTARECDAKGNTVKEYTYNTLDSTTKFYRESGYAENGLENEKVDESGENRTAVRYAEGSTRVREKVLPNGSRLAYGYDGMGRVTAITQSTAEGEENSTKIKYTLNCPTRLTSGNNVVYYEYDRQRRVSRVTANGTETRYEYAGGTYDGERNITSPEVTVDGETYAAKKSGRVKVTRGETTEERYTDKDGNAVCTVIDGAVQTAGNYDADGMLTASADLVKQTTTRYTYDEEKRMRKAEGAELTEEYVYTERGELTAVRYTGAVEQTYLMSIGKNSKRETEFIILPNGMKCYPETDVNGRGTGKELCAGERKVYGEYVSYRKVGDHGTNMPSAVYYGLRKDGRYTVSDHLKYKYDELGNIAEITKNGERSAAYEYDALGRLVRENNRELGKTYLYEYDGNGNILRKREAEYTQKATEEIGEYTQEIAYGYDGDRLTDWNGTEIEYDGNGNPTGYKGKTLEWQYGKRLVKYGEAEFAYDGYGRRTRKGDTYYFYDTNGRLLGQRDNRNVMEFVYDSSGLSGFKYNREEYLYQKNIQGDIIAILNLDGEVIAEYRYDAWGNCEYDLASGIATANPFRYRGYYYDQETGLYFLQTRYYDPETGRFISQDDVTYLDPEHINGLNLYAYCCNNPVMNVDPTGTSWWSRFWKSVAGAIVKIVVGVVAIAALGVASVLTGGAAAAIFTGAFIGAAAGGLSSSIIAISTGQSLTEFANSFLSGVVIGGITGAISGIGTPVGVLATSLGAKSLLSAATKSVFQATIFQVGANAIIGGTAYLVDCAKNGQKPTWVDFGITFAASAFGGLLPIGISAGIMSVVIDYVSDQAKRLLKNLK